MSCITSNWFKTKENYLKRRIPKMNMKNKNFLLMSLEDTKIKKVSNVISNDSCRKILDYLSNKDATESELAEKLGIPISTVHYNLQQLIETSLISANEFHYSKKGREVSHYRLANKYIIIAPKTTFGIKQRLRNILPVLLIVGGAAGIIQIFFTAHSQSFAEEGLMIAESGAAEKSAMSIASQVPPDMASISPFLTNNIAIWFLFGAFFALAAFLLINRIRKEH